MRSALVSILAMPILFFGCAAPPVAEPKQEAQAASLNPHQTRVDDLAEPYITGEYIVGMSVGILTPEGRFTYHYGVTRRGGPAPDDGTLYEIGSITKTMTGLLLADGVIRGRYGLDTPVQELLGDEPDPRVDPAITLRRLATHTSGLPRMPSNNFSFNPLDPYRDYDEAKLLALLASPAMIGEPGKKASYSNLGVGLLGYALARDQKTTYAGLLHDRVLLPLGMGSTTIAISDAQAAKLAQAHNIQGEPVRPWSLNVLAGAGDVNSTIEDMLTYAEAQLDPSATPLHEAILLSHQRQTEPGGPALGEGMGLGWFFAQDGAVLLHNGQTGGYHCFLAVSPRYGSAVVVLTNTADSYGSMFGNQLRQMLEGRPVQPVDLHIPAVMDLAVLGTYAGQYMMEDGRRLDILCQEGRLYAQIAGQPRIRIYAVDEDTFGYRVIEATIDFKRDGQGGVTGLILHQDGDSYICSRVTPVP